MPERSGLKRRVQMTFRRGEKPPPPVTCLPSLRPTFSTQSGHKAIDEREHLVSKEFCNLDTRECSFGSFSLWSKIKCFQAHEEAVMH